MITMLPAADLKWFLNEIRRELRELRVTEREMKDRRAKLLEKKIGLMEKVAAFERADDAGREELEREWEALAK